MNDQRFYLLVCNQRSLFTERLFPHKSDLTEGERDQIRRIKLVIYEGFKKATENGLPKDSAAILVDEQLGKQILINAPQEGFQAITHEEEIADDKKVIKLDDQAYWQPIQEFFKGHIDGYAAAVDISENIIKAYQKSTE